MEFDGQETGFWVEDSQGNPDYPMQLQAKAITTRVHRCRAYRVEL